MTNRLARHDDSTLFRLDDLVAIAKTPASPDRPTDPHHDVLDHAIASPPPLAARADLMAAPALLAPAPDRRTDRRVVALIAGLALGAAATVALAAAVVIEYTAAPRDVQPAKAHVVLPPERAPEAPTVAKAAPAKPAPLAPSKAKGKAPEAKAKVKVAKAKAKVKVAKAKAKAKVKVAKAKAKAKVKVATVASRPKPKGELERLIASIGEPAHGARKPVVAKPTVALPKSLERIQIQRVMRTQVFGAVSRCYERFHVPGFAFTKITIARSGAARARVTGRFARTPTGSCVESAVRRATFPPFSGAPITVSYPFRLR